MECKICGKEFEPKVHNSKYCSAECRREAKRQEAARYNERRKVKTANRDRTKICQICGKPFEAFHNEVFCSQECRDLRRTKYRLETPITERPHKKIKGLDGLEKQLKKKGDFFDEYHKWKVSEALKRVEPINTFIGGIK